MKKIVLVTVILGLLFFSCTKKTENANKQAKVEWKMYLLQQVPFASNLAELEKLGNIDFNLALENYKDYDPKTLDKIAFKLGSDIADALVCLKAENKSKLEMIIRNLPKYGETLGVSKQFIMLGVSLKPLIADEKWIEIEQKLTEYQQKILDELYNMESFDLVFLVQYGGWVKGLEDVSYLLSTTEVDQEITRVLSNKTMIVALDHDIANIDDESIISQQYFKNAVMNTMTIKDIIFGSKDGTFDQEQLQKINKLAKEITDGFSR